MKLIQNTVLLAVLLFSFSFPNIQAQGFDKKNATSFLDSLFETGKLNGSVLVAREGEVILQRQYGLANCKEQDPLQLNSSFRLASISKQFTAMCIMLLQEQDKLEYDDAITKYFPDLPYEKVTLRHLMTHTSGMPDYVNLFSVSWDPDQPMEKKKTAYNQDVVDFLAQEKPELLFEPSSRWEYSNTAYVLLASVVSEISGLTIHEFLGQHIFEPLQMTESAAFNPNADFGISHRVYGFDGDNCAENDWNFLNGMVGDGGIYASAPDLLKWDRALYTNKLIKQETLEEAFQPTTLSDGSVEDYGFGWGVHTAPDNKEWVGHSGGWVGFSTHIERCLDDESVIIILTNNSGDVTHTILRYLARAISQ